MNGCRTRCALAYWETITNGAAEALPDTLRAGVLGNNHKRLCEALPATLRSVPEALRSALDVLRNAPEPAAGSGESLREAWSGERVRPAQPATTPASSLKPSALDELSGKPAHALACAAAPKPRV